MKFRFQRGLGRKEGRNMENNMMFLSLLFLVVCSSSFSSASDVLGFPSTPKFPRSQAEKLIRELNLLPKDAEPVDVDADSREVESPKSIVEARVRFPGVDYSNASVSVEDLGHHAGYYKIKHSRAAKFVSLKP